MCHLFLQLWGFYSVPDQEASGNGWRRMICHQQFKAVFFQPEENH